MYVCVWGGCSMCCVCTRVFGCACITHSRKPKNDVRYPVIYLFIPLRWSLSLNLELNLQPEAPSILLSLPITQMEVTGIPGHAQPLKLVLGIRSYTANTLITEPSLQCHVYGLASKGSFHLSSPILSNGNKLSVYL